MPPMPASSTNPKRLSPGGAAGWLAAVLLVAGAPVACSAADTPAVSAAPAITATQSAPKTIAMLDFELIDRKSVV